MEFIDISTFLKENDKVKGILITWWEQNYSDYDLVTTCKNKNNIFFAKDINNDNNNNKIPLLTEGQLRNFIEDQTNGLLEIKINIDNDLKLNYTLILYSNKNDSIIFFKGLGDNLLLAYWKVAVRISNNLFKERKK